MILWSIGLSIWGHLKPSTGPGPTCDFVGGTALASRGKGACWNSFQWLELHLLPWEVLKLGTRAPSWGQGSQGSADSFLPGGSPGMLCVSLCPTPLRHCCFLAAVWSQVKRAQTGIAEPGCGLHLAPDLGFWALLGTLVLPSSLTHSDREGPLAVDGGWRPSAEVKHSASEAKLPGFKPWLHSL